jgi:hypothetical protein
VKIRMPERHWKINSSSEDFRADAARADSRKKNASAFASIHSAIPQDGTEARRLLARSHLRPNFRRQGNQGRFSMD